jgi:hypothetical protein
VELIDQVLLPELVKSPAKVSALPLMENPPLPNVTAPTEVRKLFVLLGRVAPLNTSASPFTGAAVTQLATVDQLSSPPPPFQVIVAAEPIPTTLKATNDVHPFNRLRE